mmetsp:Transcript_14288/g.16384  ORF Transcript_14288/g.16384 Transcript_14288/m.16384 type:complete len:258 (-) Transcript_14288:77-850(-)|eukprot:CAMPEP_0194133612 /NCGR_PEP_ID=MMETSP0152-20130528/3712_1 /TAXON_ID=1049557 /ORGANISM="Thalassiothrix antarctica, Strain L6-D1" /LENGTH=257 /DNA_ID=CAMNT_0038828949 /DNA_START=82 /DNA_END=855 /DNA_ORIENTATION=+
MASVRSLISATSRVSTLAVTSDALLGSERLLLASTRALLQQDYQSQLSSGDYDVVATSLNTNAFFLKTKGFFSDMNRNNDITYYVVGRGRKGVDEKTGEEFAFEVQPNGGTSRLGKTHFCIPRAFGVSAGEEMRFAASLAQLNKIELQNAAAAEKKNDDFPLLGSTIYFGDVPPSYVEFQILELVKDKNPDVFVIHNCDSDDQRTQLQEIKFRNEKRKEMKHTRNTTGMLIPDAEESEVGFDIPFLLMQEGTIDEVL